ncbi:MAG TPA: hypothetical protein VF179_04815 [Thermoanaerobaculia bacterium]|nr:hypothetical protein [Thermoanaerobaculia bacterium]
MAKNQRESEHERRKTDGGICAVDVSSVLTVEEPISASQAHEAYLETFDILLTKVDLANLDRLAIGEEVGFRVEGSDLAAYVANSRIGHVAPKDRAKVRLAMSKGARAWIRDIYDKGIAIRIEV